MPADDERAERVERVLLQSAAILGRPAIVPRTDLETLLRTPINRVERWKRDSERIDREHRAARREMRREERERAAMTAQTQSQADQWNVWVRGHLTAERRRTLDIVDEVVVA